MKITVVANWKNNPQSLKEAKKLFDVTKKMHEKCASVSLIVAPPAIYLAELAGNYRGSRIKFAAQAAYFDAGGAHTGEITLAQVKNAGATHIIVGHSERRERGESNEDIQKLIVASFEERVTPILCVGEKTRDRDGEYLHFVRDQLRSAMAALSPAQAGKVIIAYEPVWAIGSPEPMNPRDMHEMSIFIRKTVYDMHGKVGMTIPVLYGGAVTGKSAGQMLVLGDVNGLIVGRASADIQQVEELLSALSKLK